MEGVQLICVCSSAALLHILTQQVKVVGRWNVPSNLLCSSSCHLTVYVHVCVCVVCVCLCMHVCVLLSVCGICVCMWVFFLCVVGSIRQSQNKCHFITEGTS